MKILKKILPIFLLISLLFSLCSCGAVDFLSLLLGDKTKDEDVTLSTESVYAMAKDAGYTGSLEDFIEEFKGERGSDGVGIANAVFSNQGHLILVLTNGNEIDCGYVGVGGSTGISINSSGNWCIDGVDTGYTAVGKDGATWHTGIGAPAADLGAIGDLYLDTASSDIYRNDADGWTLIANIQGDGITVNEGDDYTITVNGTPSNVAAASKALLSAVSINANFKAKSYPYDEYVSGGSGVIYSLDKDKGDAYVITNYHVIYDSKAKATDGISDEVYVYLYGLEYSDYAIPATVLGGSMNYDIAVLKITDSEVLRTGGAIACDIASSSEVRVLDTAIAIGNAEGKGLAATVGSVSVESEILEMTSLDGVGTFDIRVMRIDTAVNHGNSGGGLFNSSGKLIGIVNAKEVSEDIDNIGYAIPSNVAVAVAENVIRNCDGTTARKVVKPLVGITVTSANNSAVYDEESGTVIKKQSVRVEEVSDTGAAYGYILAGDIILSVVVEGVEYTPATFWEVGEFLLYAIPDSEVSFKIQRNGETITKTFTIPASSFSEIK